MGFKYSADLLDSAGLPAGSATYGQAVPVVYGHTRVALPNVFAPTFLWNQREGYVDSNAVKLYRQGVMALISQGPITGLGRIWKGKDLFANLAAVETANPFTLFLGASTQSPWSFLSSGTAVDTHSCLLTVPSVGPYSVQVTDPTFLIATSSKAEHPTYNWFPGKPPMTAFALVSTITDSTQYTKSGNILTFHSSFAGSQIVVTWTFSVSLAPYAQPYNGIAYIASQALELGQTNSLPQFSAEVYGLISGSSDCSPSDILVDILTNGVGLSSGMVDVELGPDGLAASGLRRWCAQSGQLISPAFTEQKATSDHLDGLLQDIGATCLWSESKIKFRPLGESSIGTYSPYTTARYGLTNDHFITDDGQPPVLVDLVPQVDTYNTLEVRYLEGSPASGLGVFDEATVTYSDSTDVALRGVVKGSQVDARCITNGPQARRLAEWLTVRQLRKTATYTFTLGSQFILLEPGDIVTLTETGLGLSSVAVIITRKEESSDKRLTFTAEPWLGLAHPATISVTTGYSDSTSQTQTPAQEANAPTMDLSPDGLTAYIAASGSAQGYGSAQIWTSWDNSSWVHQGTLGAAVHGSLTGGLPVGAVNDTTNTLGVDVSACGRAIPAASTAAPGFALVGSEVISFSAVTSTGPGTYALTGLSRGLRGSLSSLHYSGCGFLFLDSSVLQFPVSGHGGATLYVKLVPVNGSGVVTGSLGSAIAWTLPIPPAPGVGSLPFKQSWDTIDLTDWTIGTTAAVLSLQPGSIMGGKVLRCAGAELWMTSKANIPVDAAKIYKLHVRYRQVVNPTTGNKYFTAGLAGVAADGVTLCDKNGAATVITQHFYPDSVQNLAGDGWHDYVAYWYGLASTGTDGGASSSASGQFQTNVRYVRPLLAFNVGGGDSTIEVDAIDLEEVVQGADLADGAVSLPKLSVGFGMNILSNGDFCGPSNTVEPTGWQFYNGSYGSNGARGINLSDDWTLGRNAAALTNAQSRNTPWLHQSVGPINSAWFQSLYMQSIPAVVGQKYVASVYSGAHRCKVTILLRFADSSLATLQDFGNGTGAADTNNLEQMGGDSLGGYKRIYCSGVAPAGTAFVQFEVRKWDTATGYTDSYGFFCRAQLEPVGPNVTTPTPWSSAGRTIIDGSGIVSPRVQLSNYAEDGSGNPTAGALMDSKGTALKVAPGNLQIGRFVFADMITTYTATVSDAGTTVVNLDSSTWGNYTAFANPLNFTVGVPVGALVATIGANSLFLSVISSAAPGTGKNVQWQVVVIRLP